jgi:hypothetical protein
MVVFVVTLKCWRRDSSDSIVIFLALHFDTIHSISSSVRRLWNQGFCEIDGCAVEGSEKTGGEVTLIGCGIFLLIRGKELILNERKMAMN